MKNKSIVLISLGAIVALFVAVLFMYKGTKQNELVKLSQDGGAPFVREHSVSFGDNKKSVTVVEFMDPQCEACGYFHPIIKSMYKENYEDIKLVYRYLDNHNNSKLAVKFLETARKQDKYNEVLDVIFKTQNKWAIHGNEKPQLLWQFISELEGLDFEKFKKDFENLNIDEMLEQDRADARTLSVRGTPTIFVNGKKLQTLSAKSLMDLVESEIYK